VLAGGGIALVAPAGTGKTSVAAHLVAAGADFLTDDVLALERGDESLVAHPGPARLALTAAERRSLAPEGRTRLGRVAGRSDKLLLEPEARAGRCALRRIYFLERGRAHRRLGIDTLRAEAAPRLLGSAFLPYLDDPQRLLNRLDVCARLAVETPMHVVRAPAEARAADVAAAVAEHAA
jgi:hypothetical protein